MKLGAWLWGSGLILVIIASGAGWLVRISPVLVSVPAALFAVGAGAFCIGRPGLVTVNRILSCVFAALLAIVASTHFPFRAMFLASRVDLEQTAGQVAKGKACGCQSAGWFSLSASEVSPDGSICLWTQTGQKERVGFVKTTAPKVLGALQEIDLGDGWRYVLLRSE